MDETERTNNDKSPHATDEPETPSTESAVNETVDVTGAAQPPVTPSAARTPKTWTFRRWVAITAGVGVLVVGLLIGAATQRSSITELEDENAALSATNERLDRQRSDLADEVNDREAQRKADEAEAERIAAEQEQQAQEKAAADQKAAEEAAAAAAAAEAARNTIPGNGIFAVGPEKAPGRYRTEGPTGANPVGCYYAILRAPTSDSIDNIIDNNIVNGPGFADLPEGTFFESTSCQDWVRVG